MRRRPSASKVSLGLPSRVEYAPGNPEMVPLLQDLHRDAALGHYCTSQLGDIIAESEYVKERLRRDYFAINWHEVEDRVHQRIAHHMQHSIDRAEAA